MQVLRKNDFLNNFILVVSLYIFLGIPVIHNYFHRYDVHLINSSEILSLLFENKNSNIFDKHQMSDEREPCHICNFLKYFQIIPIVKNSKIFHEIHLKYDFFPRLLLFSYYINKTNARSPPY